MIYNKYIYTGELGSERFEMVGVDPYSFLRKNDIITEGNTDVIFLSVSNLCDILSRYYKERDSELMGFYSDIKSGVYRISSITFPEKCYIGSSKKIFHRWLGHVAHLKKGTNNRLFQAHVNIYGLSDLMFEILEECPETMLQIREQHYLDVYRDNACFSVYKRVDGIGHPVYQDTKDKLREKNIGSKKPPMTEEQKDRIRRRLIGHTVSQETRDKLRKAKGIPVSQYDLDGKFIRDWDSIKQASTVLSIDHNGIKRAMSGFKKDGTYKGFIWKRKK